MSTTREQQIAAIRAACIKANPEIVAQTYRGSENTGYEIEITDRPIRLADVLLALPDDSFGWGGISRKYLFFNSDASRSAEWNLRTDDLTAQTDECIAFIHSLICV